MTVDRKDLEKVVYGYLGATGVLNMVLNDDELARISRLIDALESR